MELLITYLCLGGVLSLYRAWEIFSYPVSKVVRVYLYLFTVCSGTLLWPFLLIVESYLAIRRKSPIINQFKDINKSAEDFIIIIEAIAKDKKYELVNLTNSQALNLMNESPDGTVNFSVGGDDHQTGFTITVKPIDSMYRKIKE